ncbi:hypothetical protein JTB14_012607 [Gonioctena quinquepunctata]|nr:hypothetical protein JTB14_012607 [Gonioctena quinquepunctata]
MAYKMQVNELNQDELIYEGKIRGLATGTCDEMRHASAMAIRLEDSGDSVKYSSHPLSTEKVVEAVEEKLGKIGLL